MTKKNEPVYDESKITTLSSLEHIRLRPGMYIGRLGNGSNAQDGIYILLKEVVDNCIDEFIMGYGNKIQVGLKENRFIVRDYGRGIPLGKIVECVSIINTGAKYNSDVFQFSVGLNGVGTKAVNALSAYFRIRSIREGKYKEAIFVEGKFQSKFSGSCDDDNGTIVEFEPSIAEKIFPANYKVNELFIQKRLWEYAYLNRGLTLFYNKEKFFSKNGLLDYISKQIEEETLYDIIYYRDEQLEFAFSHTNNYGENFSSFVNGQHTNDGGTHQSAFKEGILKGVNEYVGKNYQSQDVRDGIYGTIAVKIKEPVFESQTKNKLSNTEIRSEIVNKVKAIVSDYLHKNKRCADRVMEKITHNEKMRRNIQDLKKYAKDKAQKANLKIPKLRDCKHHFNEKTLLGQESMIFLTEGDSATGSMISCRDSLTQALFPLRGKPFNTYNATRETIYKNEELYYIMKALNIEDSIDDLRYKKIIIATDADQDGLHIRNLLLTYFFLFFENLVVKGHLYILETPLFRVRNKQKTIYCFDNNERDIAIKKLKNYEMTRFKGLGEISPREFGPFIGEDMRILPVTVNKNQEISKIISFYMGKNTPERKKFIMDNMI